MKKLTVALLLVVGALYISLTTIPPESPDQPESQFEQDEPPFGYYIERTNDTLSIDTSETIDNYKISSQRIYVRPVILDNMTETSFSLIDQQWYIYSVTLINDGESYTYHLQRGEVISD